MNAMTVRVTVPPDERYLRILRMVTSSSAAESGLSVSRIEDLTLAVDEAATSMLPIPGVTALECTVDPDPDGFTVRVAGINGAPPAWPPPAWSESLAALVLDSVTAGVALEHHDEGPTVSFTMGPS